ncbi:MAG: vacJ like lipofamily protein [Micavibrio sp.]|nr:vacJ like lipofamily protein [Micavibrio sp.]
MKTLKISLIALLLAFSAPAFAQEDSTASNDDSYYEEGYAGYYDPLEGVNRQILKFNNVMDKYVFYPLIDGYRFIVPSQGRKVISNFLRNLKSPVDLANQILQGDWDGMKNTAFRFTVNTFAGFGGTLDVAAWEGYEHESEDFGQTMAVWGIGDGPYLVIPFLGPASMRDGLGYGVDGLMNPINHYYNNTDERHIAYKLTAASFFEMKNQLSDFEKSQKKNSFDYYSALRSVIYQNRQSEIADYKKHKSNGTSRFVPQYEEY